MIKEALITWLGGKTMDKYIEIYQLCEMRGQVIARAEKTIAELTALLAKKPGRPRKSLEGITTMKGRAFTYIDKVHEARDEAYD